LRRLNLSRSAFTLIELLVVIAIIAILIGLLLPAVQKVREAAARSKCSNNIKQLALACHSYADVNQGLPPAMVVLNGANWNNPTVQTGNTFGPSWVILILPYIEQGPLYNQVSTNITNYQSAGTDTGWMAIRGVTIPTMICPSDPNNTNQYSGGLGGWARGNYAANMGPLFPSYAGSGFNGASSSSNFSLQGQGPMWFTSRAPHRCQGIQQITDGSSNTIMIGELRAGTVTTDPRGVWALGHVGSATVGGYANGDDLTINASNSGADDVQGCQDNPQQGMGCWASCPSQQQTLRSQHTAGAMAGFGDGSVRFLRNSLSTQSLYQLGSGNDGAPLQGDATN
jgi:prepilin-type N-terminal cleavage/methylation domain-containing protein